MTTLLRSVLFLLICLLSFTADAQTKITGTIINSETGDPIPFAYVKKKKINRGAITNEDGYFELDCRETDTLIISFVSYDKIEVPYTYFIKHERLLLKPSNNELATVDVYADFGFLYDVFEVARQNLKQAENYPTKTYFALETATSGIPVELLECYYNAEIGPSGINDLQLKNGRIGMSEENGTYFTSLNTTQIISDYRLLNKRNNQFPTNPLQLNKRQLKRVYKLKLEAFEAGVYKISFTPKNSEWDYFNASVWVDKETEQLVQINLHEKGLKKHPFTVIDRQHKMDSLNFDITYTFSNDSHQSLDKIAFNYELKYDNEYHSRVMQSGGVFLFFEKDAEFDLPYYTETDHKLTDYDKIVGQPYNERFWAQNEVISPSRKSIAYQAYLKRAGVLLNFDELAKHNNQVFKNRIVEWSAGRVLLDDINQFGNFQVAKRSTGYHTQIIGDLYNFQAHIYLDRNVYNDTVYYLSKTLIDLEDSYYYLKVNKNTTCIINTYYDLIEFERRSMMEVLESAQWSKLQVDSIYVKSQDWIATNLKYYLLEVNHGENDAAVKRFNKVIFGNLGINNSLLIWSDFMAEKIEVQGQDGSEPWIQLYNYGTALLEIGQYEESLQQLLQAFELNNSDPWLAYNIGLNYLKLGQIKKGCEFLSLAKEKGEEVPDELTSECEN
ncbi:MAG: tetratricopeptide repeat protein [Crocinitomix sp.]|nr:tetratricopeptide repeat protein [Crocinitomix sp.]